MKNDREIVVASLNRCTRVVDFIDRFYERFLASSPDVRRKFARTDFRVQRRVLSKSLALIADATAGRQKSLQELNERARTHDRDHLDITPELYDLWLEALIETVEECDMHYNATVGKAWRKIMGFAVDYMKARY